MSHPIEPTFIISLDTTSTLSSLTFDFHLSQINDECNKVVSRQDHSINQKLIIKRIIYTTSIDVIYTFFDRSYYNFTLNIGKSVCVCVFDCTITVCYVIISSL